MSTRKTDTKTLITDAANKLFYQNGIKGTSVDSISAKAGITKRTFYYHFPSKDDLITAYLESRDLPNLIAFQNWFKHTDGDIVDKITAIFDGILEVTSHSKWRGCGYQRTVGELANKPGHPAIKAASIHKKNIENWLREELNNHGLINARVLALQISILLEGTFSTLLIHREPRYIDEAKNMAIILINYSMQK